MSRDIETGHLGPWDILPSHFGKIFKAASDNTKKNEKIQTIGRIPTLKLFLCIKNILFHVANKTKIFKYRI